MKMYEGDGRENPENEKRMKPRKYSPCGCPPLPPSTKREVVSPERAKFGEYV